MAHSTVKKLTLLSSLLLGAPAFACRTAYCAQRLAPANEQSLPANARAVIVAGRLEEFGRESPWRPWVRRVDADGGVRELFGLATDLQPSGDFGKATLFQPGPLTPGEGFRLESSGDCSGFPETSAEVVVVEAAPLPIQLGVPVVPSSIRIEGADGYSCEPSSPWAMADVFLDVDESVRPWLSVARVNLELNGSARSTDYGRLARGFDGGSRVFVERLTRNCVDPLTGDETNTLVTWLVSLELELPGESERTPRVEFPVEMDCRQSQSCSSAGAAPLLALGLVLWRRRKL